MESSIVLLTMPYPFVLTQFFAIYVHNNAIAARRQRLFTSSDDTCASLIASISQTLNKLTEIKWYSASIA